MKTVKEEYETMKSCIRIWNTYSNYDSTPYIFFLEHYTKKSKCMFLKLLHKDYYDLKFKYDHGVIAEDKFNRQNKILTDIKRSINNMNII